DGLHAATWTALGTALASVSRDLDVPMRVGLSTDDGQPVAGPPPAFVLRLAPADGAMPLHLSDASGETQLPWVRDPSTLALVEGAPGPHPPPAATAVTLYSGGAAGAEAAFGDVASRHGVREVNFTFESHRQARTAGSVLLSPRELEAGDVSLV